MPGWSELQTQIDDLTNALHIRTTTIKLGMLMLHSGC